MLQARLDLQAQLGIEPEPSDVEKSQSAWRNALANWRRLRGGLSQITSITPPPRSLARPGRSHALGDAKAASLRGRPWLPAE